MRSQAREAVAENIEREQAGQDEHHDQRRHPGTGRRVTIPAIEVPTFASRRSRATRKRRHRSRRPHQQPPLLRATDRVRSVPGPRATTATTMIATMASTDPPVTTIAARWLLQPRRRSAATRGTTRAPRPGSPPGGAAPRPGGRCPGSGSSRCRTTRDTRGGAIPIGPRGPANAGRWDFCGCPPRASRAAMIDDGERSDEHGHRNRGGRRPTCRPPPRLPGGRAG